MSGDVQHGMKEEQDEKEESIPSTSPGGEAGDVMVIDQMKKDVAVEIEEPMKKKGEESAMDEAQCFPSISLERMGQLFVCLWDFFAQVFIDADLEANYEEFIVEGWNLRVSVEEMVEKHQIISLSRELAQVNLTQISSQGDQDHGHQSLPNDGFTDELGVLGELYSWCWDFLTTLFWSSNLLTSYNMLINVGHQLQGRLREMAPTISINDNQEIQDFMLLRYDVVLNSEESKKAEKTLQLISEFLSAIIKEIKGQLNGHWDIEEDPKQKLEQIHEIGQSFSLQAIGIGIASTLVDVMEELGKVTLQLHENNLESELLETEAVYDLLECQQKEHQKGERELDQDDEVYEGVERNISRDQQNLQDLEEYGDEGQKENENSGDESINEVQVQVP
ncbi:unnamed protein product [Darwinula stevensoni]|uniref:Uncharacterized protein n=1 Tax=Darwinula stevensoni TaxID=69355 RepID=A0A7R8X5C9_9CRUS|nr:unnamed protein product [Darwinula stevensoni]CAG0886974.1 unnamed protein product [Darwinula stevensoni]